MRTIQGTTNCAEYEDNIRLQNEVNELKQQLRKQKIDSDTREAKLKELLEFYQLMWKLSDDEIKALKADRAEDLYIEARYGGRTA